MSSGLLALAGASFVAVSAILALAVLWSVRTRMVRGSSSPPAVPEGFAEDGLPVTRVTTPTPVEGPGDGVTDSGMGRTYRIEHEALEPGQEAPGFRFEGAGRTDPGRHRKKNEDHFGILIEAGVFVVADGMGGHQAGEVASKLACDIVKAAFSTDTAEDTGENLADAVQDANAAVWDRAEKDGTKGMGTTLIAARFCPRSGVLNIAHVGDSRCYRYRDGGLTQLTTDHCMGTLGVEGPNAAVLTRAVGISPLVDVDLILALPRAGDRYLMCSDGLHRMLDDDAIAAVLAAETRVEDAVAQLVDDANDLGGKDNITAVLVQVEQLDDGVDP